MLRRPSAEAGIRPHPVWLALSPGMKLLPLQLAAAVIWLMLAMPLLEWQDMPLPSWLHAMGAGIVAAALGHLSRLPSWWMPINFLFIPSLFLTQRLALAPYWYLASFVLLLLVYGSVGRSRVPLYLSSRKAWHAVLDLVPPNAAVVDLGSGLGGLLAFLSRRRPDGRYEGIENAPLPFLFSWLRGRLGGGHYTNRWNSMWKVGLESYDVAYAYLSPVPMAELWRKVKAEMRPGTLFISNTFAVPGVEPSEVVQVDDLHHSRLYLYRL